MDTLTHDPFWSSKELVALLQGLRCLVATGGHRVNIPDIEVDLR